MKTLKWIQPGYVVELQEGCWLLSADADPSRTLVLENATRWPTERSAQRALSRTRKASMKKFATAKIYGTDLDKE